MENQNNLKSEKQQTRRSWKKNLWLISVAICAIVLAGSAIRLWMTVSQSRQEDKTFLELAKIIENEAPENQGNSSEQNQQETEELPGQNRYAIIADKNPDFAGWLKIEDTRIDYPVMHTPEDIQYYIRRDFYGKESVSGTLFIGNNCSTDSLSMIIYGHNMKNDTMFGSLDKYNEEAYWRQHPTIRFRTVDEEREYEIFAAFQTRLPYENEKGFRYYEYVGDLTAEQFKEFTEQISTTALYNTGIHPQYGDRILMLSTCSYHTKNGRFIVAACAKQPH